MDRCKGTASLTHGWQGGTLWLLFAVLLALAFVPALGLKALLVPVGWFCGGLLGAIGGCIFTHQDPTDPRAGFRHTTSTALGGALGASQILVMDDLKDGGQSALIAMMIASAGIMVVSAATAWLLCRDLASTER